MIVREGAPQTLIARFMYGPLDMITLTGEKVDIHVMKDAPVGEWTHLATEVTDKAGRITYTLPEEKSLGYGLYPIKVSCKFVDSGFWKFWNRLVGVMNNRLRIWLIGRLVARSINYPIHSMS